MEQFGDLAPMVQILDAPGPQTVDQLVDAFRHIDIPLPEQFIEVPKLSCPARLRRLVLPATQMVEQLVTVPTNPDTVLLVLTRSPDPQLEDESEEELPIVSQQPVLVPQSFRNVAGQSWCRVSGPTGSTGG